MAPADCLYHSDQDGFGTIQKQLVKCGWLPRKCAHRLAMAVCSCRKKLASMPTKDEQNDHCKKVLDVISTDTCNIPSNVVTFIEDCLNQTNTEDYSCCQFISVLGKARCEDFSLLSRASLSTNSKFSERDLQREINRNKKLTKHQIDIIIKKKKQKLQAHLVRLPMYPGNLLKILDLEFVTKQKNCVVESDYTQNNQNYDNKKTETVIKVWGNSDNIKTLATRMIEEARAIQKHMDEQREKRRRVNSERRLYYDTVLDYGPDELFPWTEEDVRDTLSNDYSLKAHKSARGKKKSQIMKAQASVLDGGHCLQCFKPFTNLHDRTECVFHAGYTTMNLLINKKEWSCCGKVVEYDENTKNFKLHDSTGCTTSRVHSWRTHAKSKGKDREQNSYKSN